MTGAGPLTIREAARRVNRDVKAVHSDVHMLLNAGILQKTDAGLIVFPFAAIRVMSCCARHEIAVSDFLQEYNIRQNRNHLEFLHGDRRG